VTLLPNDFEKHQCHNGLLECAAKLVIENTIEDPELKTLSRASSALWHAM
jgi:hypothetical protein